MALAPTASLDRRAVGRAGVRVVQRGFPNAWPARRESGINSIVTSGKRLLDMIGKRV
jgi:hypothetical protein